MQHFCNSYVSYGVLAPPDEIVAWTANWSLRKWLTLIA
jgi:hypothetical protein